jgi:hypothetical protein
VACFFISAGSAFFTRLTLSVLVFFIFTAVSKALVAAVTFFSAATAFFLAATCFTGSFSFAATLLAAVAAFLAASAFFLAAPSFFIRAFSSFSVFRQFFHLSPSAFA